MSKINQGRFFEDFEIGQHIVHPLPRTITEGDVALYVALTGSRYAVHSSDGFARDLGFSRRPVDDLLMFHITFGKSVVDISLNAIANLGYAEVHFVRPVYVGDTVSLTTEILGLKENSNGKSGIVYVHSTGCDQHGQPILSLKRWVMVRKRSSETSGINQVPEMLGAMPGNQPIHIPHIGDIDTTLSGCEFFWEDYQAGERLDHPEGITIDSTGHTLATNLYQNNAKVHFDHHMQQQGPMRQRLVYGGHVISLCRSIAFNGLGNAMWIYAINSGAHANPVFAGDTIYCYTLVQEVIRHERHDVGLLRLQTVGLKNITPAEVESCRGEDGKYLPNVVLDLDYTVIIPRRGRSGP
jgi:2-methylfumaryl-CoA hydratase